MMTEGVQGASQADQQSPQVLIISPTRELTLQIYGEARKFTHGSMYKPVVIYGGTSVGHQLAQLERGCNILVGTPGRLIDFLKREKVSQSVGVGGEGVGVYEPCRHREITVLLIWMCLGVAGRFESADSR